MISSILLLVDWFKANEVRSPQVAAVPLTIFLTIFWALMKNWFIESQAKQRLVKRVDEVKFSQKGWYYVDKLVFEYVTAH